MARMAHSRRLVQGFAAAALLLAIESAQAQEAPNDQRPGPESGNSNDAVIVQGLKTKDLKNAIGAYVRDMTSMDETGPLARYQPKDYCPAVLGLHDALDREITARMRQVADAAGVKPAPPGCPTSALVIVVDDKEAFIKAFQKQRPIYFKDPKGELWSPPKENGPAISWQLTQQMDPDGNPVSSDSQGVRYVQSAQGGSRINSMITVAIAMSVVIIERKALVGLSTMQIADYALMRSLTDRPPADLNVAKRLSILGVIDAPMGAETPASLTQWDFAYLKGRYASDPRSYGTRQSSVIRQSMERTIGGKTGK